MIRNGTASGTVAGQPQRVVLEAFGDPDDHLRLSTLIGEAITLMSSNTSYVRGMARRLTDNRGPRSWQDRRSDFEQIVDRIPLDCGFVLRDPDAFAEAYEADRATDWDDSRLLQERGDFFSILLKSITRGIITVERTAPDPRISKSLADVPLSSIGPPVDPDDPYAFSVAPDVLPTATWLLSHKHLSEQALDELIESGVGPALDRHLILVAYDCLPPSSRRAAYRLAVQRGLQSQNSHLGTFAITSDKSEGASEVRATDVKVLTDCGFLQTNRDHRTRMPRLVRQIVLTRAKATDPDCVEKDHRWVFEHVPSSETSIGLRIERHHHAVHGLLIQEAIDTAEFYATDLRELAIELSLNDRWRDASLVYKAIIERDYKDAYAWEYLGYNLLREDAHRHVQEILEAFTTAQELDPTNPLYHGRLLGFRGRLGNEIEGEFRDALERYTWRGVDRFASEVLKSLRRGGKSELARKLVDSNRSLIKHPEIRFIMSDRFTMSDNVSL